MATKKAKSDPDDELRKELAELSSEIDRQGLLFLVQQARTLIYNMKIDELNKEREKLTASKTMVRRTASGKPSVSVEEGAMGKNFILVLGTTRKTMGRDELRALVKICYDAEDPASAAPRLYRWLERFRDDVLIDAKIGSKNDPYLPELCECLKSTFKLRDSD